jgi:hypothetical protein
MEFQKEIRMHRFYIVVIALILLSGCGPSLEALQATTTQVSGEIYGTQTAQIPETSEKESAPKNSEEGMGTQEPQEVPGATPWPESSLSQADEDQLVCYQAAVLTWVDWVIHDQLLHPYRPTNNFYGPRDELINDINGLNWYTNQRDTRFIVDKGEATVINDLEIFLDTTYYLNDKELSQCDRVTDIAQSRAFLGYHPWLPEGFGPTKRVPPEGQVNEQAVFQLRTARTIINDVVYRTRFELISESGINPSYLLEVERPIWEAAHQRYGVDLPRYLQGQEVVK